MCEKLKKRLRLSPHFKRAFTVVELMVVMSVIAILFTSFNTSARFAADKTRMAGVQTDFREFYSAVELIGSKTNLSEITNSEFEKRLNSYLEKGCGFKAGISQHKDPWGNPYRYSIDITDGVFTAAFASAGRKTEQEYIFNVASADGTFEPRIVMYISMDTEKLQDTENVNTKAILLKNIKSLPNPIVGHPMSQSILEGHDAVFSVDTSTLIVTSYQWYENGVEIPGAVSKNYIKPAALSDSGNYYHCRVVVGTKEYFSDRARLDVYRLSAEQLQITSYPSKLVYSIGENFDTSGLSIKAYFNDGSVRTINDYTVVNGTNLQKTTTEIIIEYDGISCKIPIQVRDSGNIDNPIDLVLSAENISQYGISNSGVLIIPELVSDGTYWYRVKGIANNAFANCTLTSVTIPGTVESIGSSAFANNTLLQNVTISNGVKNIDASVFQGCVSLATVDIPASVTVIGGYAFADCGNVTINYGGTADTWDNISKADTWNNNTVINLSAN